VGAEWWRPGVDSPGPGTERLMKLTIGLSAEADGNPWQAAEIRQVYGHRLTTLRPDVDRALGERISRAAAPPYIRELADRVNHDHYLPLIFEALAEWSESSGRYRDFNILGGETWRGTGPRPPGRAPSSACS
jgi:hypothetical protein